MSQMPVPFDETAKMIGSRCLCLRVQRASRAIGRQFDDAFRAVGLNNWQFSLLMNLTLKDWERPVDNEEPQAVGASRACGGPTR